MLPCASFSIPDCKKIGFCTQTNRSHKAVELLTGLCVDLAEAVVAHLVHEAVEQDRRALAVHSELSSGSVVVVLLDVFACVCASPDTDHPQKLVYVCDERGKVINNGEIKMSKHKNKLPNRRQQRLALNAMK